MKEEEKKDGWEARQNKTRYDISKGEGWRGEGLRGAG